MLLVVLLTVSLAAGMLLSWWVACSLAALGLILSSRPLQPFPVLVVVAGMATYVNGSGGHLTRELSILTVVLAYGGLCVAATMMRGGWGVPRSPLTTTVLLFEAWTLIAAAHGVLAGYELRYLGLELLPLLGLLIAMMAGGLRLESADLRLALWAFNLFSMGHVVLGFISYAVNRVRAGGLWFTPIPGLMALLLFNLAIREPKGRTRTLWIVLMSLNLLHQVISLTRGYWMGLAAGFLLSFLVYGGRGPHARERWQRILAVLGWLAALVVVGVVVSGAVFGWGNTAAIFGARLISSVGTEHNTESASNFERILEWVASAKKIAEAPWVGHGLGLTLHIRHPVYQVTSSQWFIHQMYLWIWLKEGLIGLVGMLAVLAAATVAGVRAARRLPPREAAWAAAAAASTLYTVGLGFTNYPMAMVNSTFLMVLQWGIALSLARTPRWRLVWRADPMEAGQARP